MQAVTCRTLILHGDVDEIVPVDNALLLKSALSNRRGQSKMFLLSGVGHLPHIQEPHEFAKLVADFLDDTYTSYVFSPTLSFALGYRFF